MKRKKQTREVVPDEISPIGEAQRSVFMETFTMIEQAFHEHIFIKPSKLVEHYCREPKPLYRLADAYLSAPKGEKLKRFVSVLQELLDDGWVTLKMHITLVSPQSKKYAAA